MKPLFLLVLAFFSLNNYAQISPGGMYGATGGVSRSADIFNPNGSLSLRINGNTSVNNKSSVIEGSKYLFPVWDGNYIVQSTKKMRYNLNSLNYNLETKKLNHYYLKIPFLN